MSTFRSRWMRGFFIISLLSWGIASPTHATLIGDSVDLTASGCGPCTEIVVEGGAPEFSFSGGTFSINVEESSFEVAYVPPTGGTGFGFGNFLTLSSLNWVNDPTGIITGLTLTNNGVSGLSASNLSFTDNSVTVDLGSTGWGPADNILVDLQTFHPAAVPAPSAMLLMGSGLVGLIAWRWRKERLT